MNNNNFELREDLKAITVTIIFEASSLNRDEKLGGNIPSIKKLTRFGNKTYSYISRVAIRHYLFETLNKYFPDYWRLTPTYESGSGENKVVQFDLRKANILNYAELDAFGYMFTEGGQSSITRKAAIGITKAVALETWEGDMQFNANHDLASRCGANPNPVNKEEQVSYFKVSFTIDIEKLGCDEWCFENSNFGNGILTFKFPSGLTIDISNVQPHGNGNYVVRGLGSIQINNDSKKALLIVDKDIKRMRLCQIIEVLKNGLIYHTSGENYGIVPQFIIAAGLKLPIPLFNSFVELGRFENSILDNAYILCEDNKRLVYIYNPKNLAGEIETSKLYTDWNEFLKQLGVKCGNSED